MENEHVVFHFDSTGFPRGGVSGPGAGMLRLALRLGDQPGPDGGEGRGGGAVGEEVELLFLDAVFHVSVGAGELLVEIPAAGELGKVFGPALFSC